MNSIKKVKVAKAAKWLKALKGASLSHKKYVLDSRMLGSKVVTDESSIPDLASDTPSDDSSTVKTGGRRTYAAVAAANRYPRQMVELANADIALWQNERQVYLHRQFSKHIQERCPPPGSIYYKRPDLMTAEVWLSQEWDLPSPRVKARQELKEARLRASESAVGSDGIPVGLTLVPVAALAEDRRHGNRGTVSTGKKIRQFQFSPRGHDSEDDSDGKSTEQEFAGGESLPQPNLSKERKRNAKSAIQKTGKSQKRAETRSSQMEEATRFSWEKAQRQIEKRAEDTSPWSSEDEAEEVDISGARDTTLYSRDTDDVENRHYLQYEKLLQSGSSIFHPDNAKGLKYFKTLTQHTETKNLRKFLIDLSNLEEDWISRFKMENGMCDSEILMQLEVVANADMLSSKGRLLEHANMAVPAIQQKRIRKDMTKRPAEEWDNSSNSSISSGNLAEDQYSEHKFATVQPQTGEEQFNLVMAVLDRLSDTVIKMSQRLGGVKDAVVRQNERISDLERARSEPHAASARHHPLWVRENPFYQGGDYRGQSGLETNTKEPYTFIGRRRQIDYGRGCT